MSLERVVRLEGCLNFRDLGGYPTADGRRLRWRHVFRSDALHRLTPSDVAQVRDQLGLTTVIDLRSTGELRSEGRGALEAEPLDFHHLPLFDGEAARAGSWSTELTLADRYFLLCKVAREPIARVVNALAESPGPAVYHCAAGKDRTGVISAVLLGLLGVPEEVIVADYAATQENLDAIIARLLETKGYQAMLSELPPDTLHAEGATMLEFLQRMRAEYGSLREYARDAGVHDAALARLETRLLERG
jgi:protein-tyrosine phosphatase